MATSTPSKTDLMYEIVYNPEFVPLPSPKVNVKTMVADGKPSYLMKNHATGIYYDLDETTNLIWTLVDGKRTVTQIMKEAQERKPDIQERNVQETLLFFADCNLLVSTLELAPKKRFRVASAFEIDLTLINDSNKFLRSLHSKIKPVFKRALLYGAVALVIAAAVLFASEFVSIYGTKANFEIMGSSVVGFFFYYFIALAPVIAIHEIAHAITLVHHGGKAGEMGTGLFYFGPMFYTETTDAWGLSRRDRIMVYLAGNISTLFIGAVLVFVHLFVSVPEPASHILVMVAFYCFIMSLMNFAPPFETDGYYILSDAVNVPNLRQDSYGYVGSLFRRVLGKPAKTKFPHLTKRKKRIYIIYALLSVGWIAYIVFQTTLFLGYMGQDVTAAVGSIFHSLLTTQAVQTSVVIVTLASILYFGMQITGYGFVLSAAIKKATRKPLTVEAIHDRDLAVFAYLPPQVPESLSNSLKAGMEKAAHKFTHAYEIKQVGRSCTAILRMGGTNLALVQMKDHLQRVESEFNSVYHDIITRNQETLQKSIGIYAPRKAGLTNMFKKLATEAVDAGTPSAFSVARHCKEKNCENLSYLLFSAFGTVWTIEVQPAQEYDLEKSLVSDMLLEDLTLTDLYSDTENFKKSIIYGYDSLAKLATDIDTGIKDGLANPETYQLVSLFQPVKSRIVFVGRTEAIEKKIETLAPIFVAQTWSGYVDNVLSEACFKLSALNKARLPNAQEIKGMNTGELAVLSEDLSVFAQNRDVIEECLQESEKKLSKIYDSLQQLRTTIEPSEDFKIGMIDAVFQVNLENMEDISARTKEFRKEWKILRRRIDDVWGHVEKEYEKRKPAVAKKKRDRLKIYPFSIVLSAILLVLGFQSPLVAWWEAFVAIAVIIQISYWSLFYRMWLSFCKVTKYPNQAFNMTHLFLLTLTEAVYGYATTEDILAM